MPYRENCKVEGEIVTRFKIARMYFSGGMSQSAIADDIDCHRNTVGTAIRLFRSQATDEARRYIQEQAHISKEQLNELFSFAAFASRKPKSHPRMITGTAEDDIVARQQETRFGPKRLLKTLHREETDGIAVPTLAQLIGIYKRNKLQSKKVRAHNGNRRALYDYSSLAAFEQIQCDTKDVLDQSALPPEIYRLLEKNKAIPKVQWTIIDAKTRTRFLAWSYSRSSWFGLMFIFFVVIWLRSHGIHHDMHIQFDGGSEFCSASQAKLLVWNTLLAPFGVHLSQTDGVKWKQNLVERSHRTDDEECYVPRGSCMTSKTDFLIEAQHWIFYFNTERPHSGILMGGKTPEEHLTSLGIYQGEAISRFPVIILEDFFAPLQILSSLVNRQSAQDVLTPYLPRYIQP